METTAFVRGICIGMVAGAIVGTMASPRPKFRKTAVGRAMQQMGNAVDSAVDSVNQMVK